MQNGEKKKVKIKYILSILFLILLIVVTFVVLFTKYSFNELMMVIRVVDFKYVFIGVLMIFVYIYFEGVAMRELFKAQKIKVSRKANFLYSAIDYYFCSITPSCSGGQPMVAYYMKKDNINLTNSTLVLLINTALFKIVLIILSLISAICCHNLLFRYPILVVLFIIGLIINVFLITLCFLVAHKRVWVESVGVRFIFLLSKLHIIKNPITISKNFIRKMDNYEKGALLIRTNKKEFYLALLYNFIQRIAFFSISYFVYMAFKSKFVELSGYGFIELFSIQVIIALCVDSLPLPGGVGISEYLYVLVFGIVYEVGDSSFVASAMLLTRAINFYVPLIVTGIFVVVKQLINIKTHN